MHHPTIASAVGVRLRETSFTPDEALTALEAQRETGDSAQAMGDDAGTRGCRDSGHGGRCVQQHPERHLGTGRRNS